MSSIVSQKSILPDSAARFEQRGEITVIHFQAMASPCEVHVQSPDSEMTAFVAQLAVQEASRIESKFSRYRNSGIVCQINNANGKRVAIDEETYNLLHFSARCHDVSNGMFDITSGILRRAWKFDGLEYTPDTHLIQSLLQSIGWDKVSLDSNSIRLPAGMEIDLGGIGKEYAVDRVAQMLAAEFQIPLLVNFGGDVRVISPVGTYREWNVGIENPGMHQSKKSSTILGEIRISSGGVATSGDSRRFCNVDGVRLSHILNPKTGWPVENAPRSVTVIGSNCLEAGLLSTLGMLLGKDAESFLAAQQVRHHIVW